MMGMIIELQNGDFIQLVKRTREKFGVGIAEAHDLIFADDEMRRLVALRINRDLECRKMALRDLRFRLEGNIHPNPLSLSLSKAAHPR
jgi:hypothetical protein